MRDKTKKMAARLAFVLMFFITQVAVAQANKTTDTVARPTTNSAAVKVSDDSLVSPIDEETLPEGIEDLMDEEMASPGMFKQIKTKFVEGSVGFMSLVAIALVLGLAFCIERIIYLTLSEIDAKRLMNDIDDRLQAGDVEGARNLCRNTRGPVAAICYQGLLRIGESVDNIERSIVSYGSVQTALLEKGCSWITLFIVIAPSLGFLGTVIGMVMAFDHIQHAGDISTTIVAEGMKVALITTIFGIIVALILQVFYNYILSKIEHLTSQMEESAIALLDSVVRYKHLGNNG